MSELDSNAPMTSGESPLEATPPTPGTALRAARELHGWTVDQVASHLKLAPRQVLALETDDYAALPGMPIVRGFIRSYAKLLKIDASPLLAQLGGQTVLVTEPLTPKEGLSTPFADARLPSMTEKPAISSRWVLGVLLIALLATAIWAARQEGGIFGLSSGPTSALQETLPQIPAAEARIENPVEKNKLSEPEPRVDVPSEASSGPAELPSLLTSPTPLASSASEADPIPNAAASEKNTLRVRAREESWIEIRPASGGNRAVARLMAAGDTLSIEVTEPLILVVGNAAGVDAELRGTPLQLKGSTTTNVARLSLK